METILSTSSSNDAATSMKYTRKDEETTAQSSFSSSAVHLEILKNVKSECQDQWEGSLYQDAQIVSFIHHFTQHIQKRSANVSDRILHLCDKFHDLEYEISKKKGEFYLCSNRKYVKNMIVPASNNNASLPHRPPQRASHNGDSTNILSVSNDGNNPSDMRALDNMEQLEDLAILDGMKALSIFHDPQEGMDDQYFQMEEEDSCYYYESSANDLFNQRPLPYIIGTPEFFESDDVGLGPEELNGNVTCNEITPNHVEDNTKNTVSMDDSKLSSSMKLDSNKYPNADQMITVQSSKQ